MTTFAEATLALAEVLGEVYRGEADSGSANNKLIDAALTARQGTLAPGTLWMLTGTLAGAVIDVLRHAQNTLHFATQASAVAEGDDYAVFEGIRFNRVQLELAVNFALKDLQKFTQFDETLVTVALQEDYTLPAGVSNVANIEIAESLTSPYLFAVHRGWREISTGKIRFLFDPPPIAGYKIRLSYNSTHPTLAAGSDTLKPGINLERLKWEAATHAVRKYLMKIEDEQADKIIVQVGNDAPMRAAASEGHNILRLSKQPTLSGW